MKKIIVAVFFILLLQACIFSREAAASSSSGTFPKNFDSWWNGQYLFGDWAGQRQKLSDKGIDLSGTYVTDLLTAVSGGEHEGRFRYDSSLGIDVNADLEKLAGLSGLQSHVSMVYRQGKNLGLDIGNRFPPSSIYGSEQVRLYNLYVEQAMLDDKVSLKLGRIGTGDDFAQSPLYWIFLTNSIDGCPINLPINFFFSVYPTATWGARLKASPTDYFTWKGGIYHQDPEIGRLDAHGADFSWRRNKGLLFIQELSYLNNQAQGSKGMPGNYKAGVFYNTGRFNDLYQDDNGDSYALSGLDAKRRRGNYGFYVHADQMLYREPGTADQGFTPFFVLTWQPDDINEIPVFFDGGLTYKGLIPGRDNDIAGIGYAYGKWSKQLDKHETDSGSAPQKYEMVIETTYKIAVNQWLYIQPDVQYILNPHGGDKDIEDAWVAGARVGVTF